MPEMSRGIGTDDRVEILLVEDNPGDVRLVETGLERTDSEVELHTVANGYEALYFLRDRSTTESVSLPDLLLVDLNVPGKDGCEILEAIRGDPQLRRLPVLILTSSEAPRDIARCYDSHANAYLTKPADPDAFGSLIETMERFWLDRVQLPPLPE